MTTIPTSHYDPLTDHTNASKVFWRLLGDFWNLFEDRDIMENIWGGYLELTDNLYSELYSQDSNRYFKYDKYGWECKWEKIGPVQKTTTLDVGDSRLDPSKPDFNKFLPYEGILSMPAMYKGAYKFLEDDSKFEAKEGRDYIVVKEGILFKNTTSFEGMYWAPTLFRDDDFTFEQFGAPFPINEASSDSYYLKIKGIWYAMWSGPSVSVIISGINIMLGFPVAEQTGVVTNITKNNDGQWVISMSYGKSYEFDAMPKVSVGQRVDLFQPLYDIAKVSDRLTDPEWWKSGVKIRKFDSGGKFDSGVKLDSWLRCSTPNMSVIQQFHAFKVTIAAEGLSGKSNQLEHLKLFLMRIKPTHTKYFVEVDFSITDNYFDSIDTADDSSIELSYEPKDTFWADSNFDESLRNTNRVYGWELQ